MSAENLLRWPATGYARDSDLHGRARDPMKPRALPWGHSTTWRYIKAGRFPAPIRLSQKTTVWRWEEVHEAVARIVAERAASPVSYPRPGTRKHPEPSESTDAVA